MLLLQTTGQRPAAGGVFVCPLRKTDRSTHGFSDQTEANPRGQEKIVKKPVKTADAGPETAKCRKLAGICVKGTAAFSGRTAACGQGMAAWMRGMAACRQVMAACRERPTVFRECPRATGERLLPGFCGNKYSRRDLNPRPPV